MLSDEVGTEASIISKIIRGKNKTTFTPHMDDGDFVIVKNIKKIKCFNKIKKKIIRKNLNKLINIIKI